MKPEVEKAASEVMTSGPTVHDYIEQFGAERVRIKGDEFEVVLHDPERGIGDKRDAHLGSEMMQRKWEAEERLARSVEGPVPEPPKRRTRGLTITVPDLPWKRDR